MVEFTNWITANDRGSTTTTTTTTTTTVVMEVEEVPQVQEVKEYEEIVDTCTHINVSDTYEILTYEEVGEGEDVEVTVYVEEELVQEEGLPFPLCPGEFWGEAIKAVYGERHLLLGYSNTYEVRYSETVSVEAGPIYSGLTLEIGKGECETVNKEQLFRVNFNVVDYKTLNKTGGLQVDLDTSREAGQSVLVAKNTSSILSKFAKFSNPNNWKSLSDEYKANSVEFYSRYIEMFYPASFTIRLNLSHSFDWTFINIPGFSGKETLLNRRTIILHSDEVLNFPPSTFSVAPRDSIELVTITETVTTIVASVDVYETTFIYPNVTDVTTIEIINKYITTGLTYEFITEYVTQYFFGEGHVVTDYVTELPFSTNPAQFWLEAVKSLYGEKHLLLGVGNDFHIKHASSSTVDVGSILTGLTVKVISATSKDDQGHNSFRLNFDIVDFKLTTKDGNVEVTNDPSRPGHFALIATNTKKIISTFQKFTKRVTWKTLTAEFEQNPARFYRRYLALFYPSSVSFSLNLIQTIDTTILDLPSYHGKKTFINRETITIITETISQFPPNRLKITPAHPIELVDRENPTVVVIHVGKFDTTLVRPEFGERDSEENVIIQETITTTFTFEFLREKVTKYIITRLPFPSDPARFFAEAIRTIHGRRQLLLGASESVDIQVINGETIEEIGYMHSAFVVEVGDGSIVTYGDKNFIQVDLTVVDFKMVTSTGDVELEYDSSRPKENSFLVLEHGDEVIEWFNSFAKGINFEHLVQDFYKCPVTFYKRHIHRFFPAIVKLGLNVRKTIDGSTVGLKGRVPVVNKKVIWIYSDEIHSFPPTRTIFAAKRPIDLIVKQKPSIIVSTMEFETEVVNLSKTNTYEITIIDEIIEGGLTHDFIIKTVTKHVINAVKEDEITELPFPTDPIKFWEHAITKLYGRDHVLFGISDTFKFRGTDGKVVDFGTMLNGLTYKIKEVTTDHEDVRITFEIIDFKLVSKDGKHKVQNDSSRPGEHITIIVQDATKIQEIFKKFKKPSNWTTLIEEYTKDETTFYKKYIDHFYPSKINIGLNLKHDHDSRTFGTDETIDYEFEIDEFPPQDVNISPEKPIKLHDKEDHTVYVVIEDFDSKLVYPTKKDKTYDVTIIEEIFEFDFEYDVIEKHVTEYIISENLPFSLRPNKFWADAIKTIYGKDLIFVGVSNDFKITTPDGNVIDLGKMISSKTLRIPDDQVDDEDQTIRVVFDITDLKVVSHKPHTVISLDKTRPGDQYVLTIKDSEKVLGQFRKIFNDTKKWDSLIKEYKQSPKSFYLKYVELFYPASLTKSFNVKITFDTTVLKVPQFQGKTLVNREIVVITHEKINRFPISDIDFITSEPIELVTRDAPDDVVATVEKVTTKIVHEEVTETTDVAIRQKIITSGITIDYVRDTTVKYVGQYIEEIEIEEPDEEVKKPEEEVKKPEEEVKKPDEEVKKPEEEVKKPEEEVKKPEEEVKKPEEEVKKPEEEVKKPEEEVKKPEEEVKKPEEEVKKPEEEVKKPEEEVKKPEEEVKKPEEEVKKPEEKKPEEVKKPIEEVKKPVEEVKKPEEVKKEKTVTGYKEVTETIVKWEPSQGLPFPLCPGEFWAEALKTIYGSKHLLLGSAENVIVGGTNVGTVLSGITLQLLDGTCFEESDRLQVKFKVLDFKAVREEGGIEITNDITRHKPVCTVLSLNGQKVMTKFHGFANPMKWPVLAKEYYKSPVEFYKKHITTYYPAQIRIGVNAKYTIDGSVIPNLSFKEPKVLINKDTWVLVSDNILSFPPSDAHFVPTKVTQLTERATTNVVVTTIDKCEFRYITVTQTDDEEFRILIKKIISTGITYEIIRKYVIIYIYGGREPVRKIPEMPFSTDPVTFWREGIKIIYGERHVFFGSNSILKLKGPNGDVVDVGPILKGLTVKIREVTETVDKEIRIHFDIVEYKGTSLDGDIDIDFDNTFPGNEFSIVVKDPTKVTDFLTRFTNETTAKTVIEEYTQNKVLFYQKYLEFFYPAQLTVHFNLRIVIKPGKSTLLGFEGEHTFVSTNPIEFTQEITEFPPKAIDINPTGSIEFVCKEPNIVVTVVEHNETHWISPRKDDEYDVVFVKEIHETGLTIKLIRRYVIEYIISKRLPFSINPGKFFSDAIKTISGNGVLLLGGSDVLRVKLSEEKYINVGPMYNGLTIKIGNGSYEEGKDIVVDLTITNLTMVNKTKGVKIHLDTTRPGDCSLVVKNTKVVVEKFLTLTHGGNWPSLIEEYNKDKVAFYTRYIQFFYPATFKTTFNLKDTVNGTIIPEHGFQGEKVFFTKEVITIVTENVTQFPPKTIDFLPDHSVEFVHADKPDDIAFTIEKFKTTWIYPNWQDDGSRVVVEKIIETGVTYEYLIVTVPKYITISQDHPYVELPFPLCPGEFWVEAIKTIYGPNHLLVGLSKEFELVDKDGNTIDDGPLQGAFTIKLNDGSCESIGSHEFVRVKFEVLDLKLVTTGGEIEFENDTTRKGEVCILEAKEITTIIEKFKNFAIPSKWNEHANDYTKDPVLFYKKYISLFYPATIRLNFNIKRIISETLTVVNKDTATLYSDEILNFPPSEFNFHLKEPIEFVEDHDRTVVIIRITKFVTHLLYIDPADKKEKDEIIEVVKTGRLTYKFILTIVTKYIIHHGHDHIVPDLPFPIDPAKFWEVAINTVLDGKNIRYGMTLDWLIKYTDDRVDNVGPMLTAFTFKNVSIVTIDNHYCIKFEIVEFKMVSSDNTVEVEDDKTVTVGEVIITAKDTKKIDEYFGKFKNQTNWTAVIDEYELSPKQFFLKHLAPFFPQEFVVKIHFKVVIGGTQTLVTKDTVTFTGDVCDDDSTTLKLSVKEPIELVETHTSTNVVATINPFDSEWINPDIKDVYELTITDEYVKKGGITYIYIREKVTKYIISKRLPFPLCPGEFFAEAIKTVYSEGHLYLGITHKFDLKFLTGETDNIGPMLSAFTLKVSDGSSWEYSHDKSIRINLDVLDFKMMARDGGFEIELDNSREKGSGYIVVNNTTEILKSFADFFHASQWDTLSEQYNINSKKFYEKYLHLFFPATLHFISHFKYTIDGSILSLPGFEKKKVSLVTKNLVHFTYDDLNDFPTGDIRLKNQDTLEIVDAAKPDVTIISIEKIESVYMYGETEDKAENATLHESVVSGLTFKFVYDMVTKYIVTSLPFSLNPGTFWVEAIKIIYGDHGHLLLGQFTSKNTITDSANKAIDVGPILGGIITTIGQGHSVQRGDNPTVYVDLNLIDMKLTNTDGAIVIDYDNSKPVEAGSLVTLDSSKVFAQFAEFSNPANWETYVNEYEENTTAFYEKYVTAFYPAKFFYNFNATATVATSGKVKVIGYNGGDSLVSKSAFSFACDSATEFPPKTFLFTANDTVTFVEKANQKKAGIRILKKGTTWVHIPTNEKTENDMCLQAIETGLSFEFVRKTTTTYMEVPSYTRYVKTKIIYTEQ